MSSKAFSVLGKRARQADILDRDEELRLIRIYNDRSSPTDLRTRALNRLVETHLKLIISIAVQMGKIYGDQHREDFVNEGTLGFINAIKKFDETKGFRLNTFARWDIKATMQSYAIDNLSSVRVASREQKRTFLHFKKVQRSTEAEHMTVEETRTIARKLGVNSEDVEIVAQRLSGDLSLDMPAPTADGRAAPLSETIADSAPLPEDELIAKDELRDRTAKVNNAMMFLPNRERFILAERRLKDPPTPLENLAAMYNVSKGRISQIEQQAVVHLCQIMEELERAERGERSHGPPAKKFMRARN